MTAWWQLTCLGRVYAVRHGGARLLFFTLAERHQSMQIICSLSSMATAGVTEDEFKRFSQVVRKGDWFCKFMTRFILLNGIVRK